ncbi:MAG TPA: tryptophan synthase subunit alpha [Thermodesulfobium narugense]|uniref:Tryptophan synthase alpha chain n=1 Tax=Thermodesulfobium acidiphilum TaxID=1794699 RepID=A0A2R4W2Y0_THEAF|nr:tryptophan synthase subunit alpha [Thermodesulfobium acidiphilum]AWB11133.1 tryptophan synthase, alpha chain [Thermodesulfobium acidiphilum]PMP84529.1 MAG: tryptophan synthase subunit alpha [Thermodesulfobium narugense]HEM56183.1 tryptophan synthase subunit alpha [Thermodesulfobium narugense]
MSKIREILKEKKTLIPFLPAGYPSLNATKQFVEVLVECGIKAIEIGIPFSDPVADGPTITNSYSFAIKNGIKSEDVYLLSEELKEKYKIAIIPMLYYNLIYNKGEENFAKRISSFADAVIVPDLPFRESHRLRPHLEKFNISYIPFATPNIREEDIKTISKYTNAFIYAVTVFGITGARSSYSKNTYNYLEYVKKISSNYVAAGFGVSSKEQFEKLPTDAVIIGSALIKQIDPDNIGKSKENIKKLINSIII